MSAAGALATALAVRALSAVPRSRAVEVAHLADLFGGGGLGGVAAILGGGLEVRTRAGVPPFGRIVHRPFRSSILVGVVGRPIPSPSVLGDPEALRRISRASRGWDQLIRGGDPAAFFRLSERFTDRAGLASPAVMRAVRALRRRGASAAQAMFGESFFALPRTDSGREACIEWLRQEGIRTVEIRAATAGARLRAGGSDPSASGRGSA
jgi:pantoate kinase